MKSDLCVALGRLCAALTGLLGLCPCAFAQPQPTTVYVYNHNPGDIFDNQAEGFILRQLGIIDANGQLIDPIPPGQIIRDNNGDVIGYRSANGTQEAYDVNSTFSTDQAWMQVAVNGTFHIAKHGAKYTPAPCGNSAVDTGEACDPPGGQAQCAPLEVCNASCQCCNNRIVEAGEQCDPPGGPEQCQAGEVCNAQCLCEALAPCGNNILDDGEACDPPGQQAQCPAGQVCNRFCQCELPNTCGNNRIDPGEACDPPGQPGNCPAGQGCVPGCRCVPLGGGILLDGGQVFDGFGYIRRVDGGPSLTCGDNTVDAGEGCDPPGGQAQCQAGEVCNAQCLCVGQPDGTGVGYEPLARAYLLTARPGDNIMLNVNACYSSNDPDDAGPQTSVTASAQGVPGVAATPGHNGPVYAKVQVNTAGEDDSVQAARAALTTAARTAGYPPPRPDGNQGPTTGAHISQWISNLPLINPNPPPAGRYRQVQDIIDTAAPPAGTVTLTLTYTKDEVRPPGGGGAAGIHVHPTRFDDQVGGTLVVPFDSYVPAFLSIPPGSLDVPGVFHANMLSVLPAPPPAGSALVSGVFEFISLGGGSIVSALTIGITFASTPTDADVRWYDPEQGTWLPPLGSVTFDPASMTALVSTQEMGTYAVFSTETANEDCTNAQPTGPIPSSTPGLNALATRDGTGCANASDHNVWFSVVGDGTTLTATLCDDERFVDDAHMVVFCSGCNTPVCVAESEDACGFFGLNPEASWCSASGVVYTIGIGSNFGDVGAFVLDITSEGAACNGADPCIACGDGLREGDEECDDGNSINDDGCSADCLIECGDGFRNPLEGCDDGNRADGDGCSSDCLLEPPVPTISQLGMLVMGSLLLIGLTVKIRTRRTAKA